MKSHPPRSLRSILLADLSSRKKANPRYSLRSYARFLDVDPSLLSKVLRELRPISNALIAKVAARLEINPEDIRGYRKPEVPEFYPISDEIFSIIADYRHDVIRMLMLHSNFRPDLNWLADKMKLPVTEVVKLVAQLIESGLIKVTSTGHWEDGTGGQSTHKLSDEHTSTAHRRYQQDITALSLEAIEKFPVDQRDHSGIMMATNLKKIKKAKKMITAFRRELCAFMEDCDEKDVIFQLSIGLYPLTEN